jgi:sulfate adenylyltransferase
MSDLIPPHGGLTEPVCRTVPAQEIEAFKTKVAGLTKLPVSDADLSTVYRFGDGALSPLEGPMDRATYERVLEESVIEHGGKLYAWTIPLSLPVTAELAKQLKPGQTVANTNSAGEVVASLDVSDVFEWDKPRYLKSVYPPSEPIIPAPIWC